MKISAEAEITMLQGLVLTSCAVTLAALCIVIWQACTVKRLSNKMKNNVHMMLRAIGEERLSRRNHYELNVIDSRRKFLDDRLIQLEEQVSRFCTERNTTNTFTDLPPPPTDAELRELEQPLLEKAS